MLIWQKKVEQLQQWNIENINFLIAYLKMKKSIRFSDIEIQKQKSHQHKEPISIKNIDINEIVICNKVSFGKKMI